MYHLSATGSNYRGSGRKHNPLNNPLRLKGKHFLTRIPTPPNKATLRRRCVRCQAMNVRKDTSYECRKCDVALCLIPCHEIYHTKVYFDRDYENNSSESEQDAETDTDSD